MEQKKEGDRYYILNNFRRRRNIRYLQDILIMKNLFKHFRNSILAVFYTALMSLALCFYDILFCKLVFLIFLTLPILLFLDFCLWIVFYNKKKY